MEAAVLRMEGTDVDADRFDALIITALFDELQAVLSFGDGGKSAWTTTKDEDGFPFHYRVFQREDGKAPLRIAAASYNEMGRGVTAARATALIKHLKPACLAMCGICAGNKKDVTLGDVIVADRVYSYDAGKYFASHDAAGHRIEHFYPDIKTYNLEDKWRVDAGYFALEPAWAAELIKTRPLSREAQQQWLLCRLLEHEQSGAPSPDAHPERQTCCPALPALWKRLRLSEHGLLVATPGELALTEKGKAQARELTRMYPGGPEKDRDFKIHIGPIATGEGLQKDPELFDRLEKLERKTLGAEMEASAIGMVGEMLERRALIVKAVSDYGDGDKDDSFRTFATRASAEVLLRFLLRSLEPAPTEQEVLWDMEQPVSSRLSFSRSELSRGDGLLSRVKTAAILRVRKTGDVAQVEEFPASPPLGAYLRVASVEGESTPVYPLAAAEEISPEVLDVFLHEVDASYRRDNAKVRSTLIYRGSPPSAEVLAKAKERGVRLRSFQDYNGIIDFGDYLKRQLQELESNPFYPPSLYVPQRAVFLSGQRGAPSDILEELTRMLASEHGRFLLVLGEFGTGKTFLLRELARKMAENRHGPVPVLIDMRKLEKVPKLDALISQHLALAGMERIDLPAFRHLLADGQIALLFDGFDELALRVSYERATEHFATLIEAAQGEGKVVLTSRRQYFLSERQVQLALTEQASRLKGYQLVELQPFTQEQILHFLKKRLNDDAAARERFLLLEAVENLLGLAQNPRMLGFIADIPKEKLLAARDRRGKITAAKLYEELLEWWLEQERKRAHPPGAEPGLDAAQQWKAVTDLAMLLWPQTERTIHIQKIPPDTLRAVNALAKHALDEGVLKHQIGSATLLVRDEKENFFFIHQSVMEWLVAREVARGLVADGAAAALGAQEISPLMADFIWGLAGREAAERWAQDALGEEATSVVRNNALLMLKQLGATPRTAAQLAGQDLSGRDLSGENLRRADLTDAILTDASLRGADLTGARLTRARMQRVDLTDAILERADLRDANLLGAKLLGARAAGARFEGASLREAKLLRARIDASTLQELDTFGAALSAEERPAPMVSVELPCFRVAFSPDGRLLASAHGGSIRLWDWESGTELRVLQGHEGFVWSVAFSHDGKTLASGSSDSTVRLWDVAQGSERTVLKGHSQSVLSVAFSHDGKTLASGSLDGTIRLWSTETGECLAALISLAEEWVAFTPDGRYRSFGNLSGAFWHVIGLCRFEPGELDPYLSRPLRVPDGELLYTLPSP